jgi:hypothetical protein
MLSEIARKRAERERARAEAVQRARECAASDLPPATGTAAVGAPAAGAGTPPP